MDTRNSTVTTSYQYTPPWNNVSIVGIAGSSGSGKSSLSRAILSALNLPWVAIIGLDSFYKPLNEEDHQRAHRNELDFDAPEAIDFDLVVKCLKNLKQGRRTDIPIYSFKDHQRKKETTSIYSPHVLIVEGILALHDPRILELMDLRIFCEADADTCLSRRLLRDVKERGRDVQGCIKQWFAFVKPNLERYVDPQRKAADIIVPRGVENLVAIKMISQHIERILHEKSERHQAELKRLGKLSETEPLGNRVVLLSSPQLKGISTIIQDANTSSEDFIFYFDRLSALLIENALNNTNFKSKVVETVTNRKYHGLERNGQASAVVILRSGAALERGLKRVIPDCKTGRILIQSSKVTEEPELHYVKFPPDISTHDSILLLDPQLSSGGAALMSVQVLIDHGIEEERIVFVTYFAGRKGLKRLTTVFPAIKVVVGEIVDDNQPRWIEERYFRC